jgi:hypothetical protein
MATVSFPSFTILREPLPEPTGLDPAVLDEIRQRMIEAIARLERESFKKWCGGYEPHECESTLKIETIFDRARQTTKLKASVAVFPRHLGLTHDT